MGIPDIGKPQLGETVVSVAAGAVGSVAGQHAIRGPAGHISARR
jgi:NADPH-dependent curcumin reductase CurA